MTGREYKRAVVKFNSRRGALLCNRCETIVAIGWEHEDREHYCDDCAREIEALKPENDKR